MGVNTKFGKIRVRLGRAPSDDVVGMADALHDEPYSHAIPYGDRQRQGHGILADFMGDHEDPREVLVRNAGENIWETARRISVGAGINVEGDGPNNIIDVLDPADRDNPYYLGRHEFEPGRPMHFFRFRGPAGTRMLVEWHHHPSEYPYRKVMTPAEFGQWIRAWKAGNYPKIQRPRRLGRLATDFQKFANPVAIAYNRSIKNRVPIAQFSAHKDFAEHLKNADDPRLHLVTHGGESGAELRKAVEMVGGDPNNMRTGLASLYAVDTHKFPDGSPIVFTRLKGPRGFAFHAHWNPGPGFPWYGLAMPTTEFVRWVRQFPRDEAKKIIVALRENRRPTRLARAPQNEYGPLVRQAYDDFMEEVRRPGRIDNPDYLMTGPSTGVLADKLDDYGDPRGRIVRWHMSHPYPYTGSDLAAFRGAAGRDDVSPNTSSGMLAGVWRGRAVRRVDRADGSQYTLQSMEGPGGKHWVVHWRQPNPQHSITYSAHMTHEELKQFLRDLGEHRNRLKHPPRRLARIQGTAAAVGSSRTVNADKIRTVAARVLREAGLTPNVTSVLAHTPDKGLRAAVMGKITERVPPALVKYVAAWWGLMTREPRVTVFHPTENGSQQLHVLKTRFPPDRLSGSLRSAGINTFVLDGSTAYVYDPDGSHDMSSLARSFDAEHSSIPGVGYVLGDRQGAVTDAGARQAYRDVLRSAEGPAPAAG